MRRSDSRHGEARSSHSARDAFGSFASWPSHCWGSAWRVLPTTWWMWACDSTTGGRAAGCQPALSRWDQPGIVPGLRPGGIALFASARERLQAVHTIVPFTVGVFLASAGPFLLLTRMGEVLDRPVGVTLLGAVAVAVAGLALLASVVRRGLHQYTFGRLLPISVGTVGAAVTFGLWLGLNADQNRRVQRQVQFEAANLQRLIHDRLADHTRSVESLAEEWPAATPERRTETVGTFVGRLPGCLGVAQVDGVSATWLESTSRTSSAEDV